MKIKCNNIPRQFIYGYELSSKQRQDFDYIPDDEIMLHEFIKYKGNVYDVSEFLRVDSQELNGWHGYASDSFFSGVLIRIVDSEHCIMASYYS